MRKRGILLVTIAAGFLVIVLFGKSVVPARGQARTEPSFAAIPSEKGGQDVFGAYDIAKDWPKPISGLQGNEKWTWGSGEGVFAESPNRVYILQRGELPNIQRPKETDLPQLGPSLSFPIGRLPWRDATVASPPGQLDGPNRGKEDVDWHWENCLVVVDAEGNILERWTQWDSKLRRPHAVYINPYDPDKYVWLVDDYRQAIFKFTHDGKTLVQTLGEVNVHGNDDKHFYRPTYLAWLPDSTMFVADGYANTRVVKFDKDGKYLTAWGQPGTPPNEMRPGYFNSVHGIAVDPQTRRVFVNDRSNHRIQVFDENGKFLDQWHTGDPPSDVHLIYMSADRHLWAADRGTSKLVKYDLEGHFQYSWGTWGDFPGGMWGVHGLHVDQEGNLYVAEVDSGRAQKFVPRKGANPAFLVGPPVRPVWK
jgi:6-phosphogluconolactonase (cycloisomerase 2 family)